ncbi:MAG: hypothetical protein D6732_20565 [Methanobacteriota archaeon]|nr:MAG: hypothetical protein D6732_20565 [Euryarchaeota archaeon]
MGKNDVSKKTVLLLLLLTVAVSVVGTWTVLNSAVNSPIYIAPSNANLGVADVNLDVREELSPPVAPITQDDSEGNVGIIIQ